MSTVIMQAVCSVDGFIADENDQIGTMFEWYDNGDVELPLFEGTMITHLSQASADYLKPFWDQIKVTIIGRRLFDITHGWGGRPPTGDHVIVVSHRPPPAEWLEEFPDAPYIFATSVEDGIAKAKELAGDGIVCVCAGDVAGQAFAAGLVDEVEMDVAPAVFGSGKRFFGSYDGAEVVLEDPTVVQGDRVTHVRYQVRR
ncbi:dihydrofolate reductase family protein [Luteipulveratus mongoliensis]|uniref:Dihydrofolate reductase n=1 Tax=Luteipulveratus mongoliensis TaxID=571913 RepID=A0A0K1JQ01_9MICO|nr:dihydrofolate reductase family protein [Luteipulveratus mongoliensis]AKU18786.1 dihydrofolate reductase [Luteipulveratus mongoliensis]